VQPIEIKVHRQSALLELLYPEEAFALSAEFLRVHSPSAEVQGHGPGQATLQVGKRLVSFRNIIPQGHYAIRIEFSDDHNSGIYSWDYLRELAINRDTYWQTYLAALAQSGGSRDPVVLALS